MCGRKNGREIGRVGTIKVLRKTMEQVWGEREERDRFVSGDETEDKKSTVM